MLDALRYGVFVQAVALTIGVTLTGYGAWMAWPQLDASLRVLVAVALPLYLITQVAFLAAMIRLWLTCRAQPDSHQSGVAPAQHGAITTFLKDHMN